MRFASREPFDISRVPDRVVTGEDDGVLFLFYGLNFTFHLSVSATSVVDAQNVNLHPLINIE